MQRFSWNSTAIGLWAVYLTVVCTLPLLKPLAGTIFPIYAFAGEDFLTGQPLYGEQHLPFDIFRYSPLVAALLVPFSWLPMGVGGLVWRLIGAAIFLTGLAAWARRVLPGRPRAGFFICALPLSHASLFNGQANPLVVGLLLWAAVSACRDGWSKAALLIAVASLFKGYPLTFGLLLMLVAPFRIGVPLALTLAAGLALPFLCQSPDYVSTQYRCWIENLRYDDRTQLPLHAGYQDVHMLLRVLGIEVARPGYLFVQAAMGVGVAAIVGRQLWRGEMREHLVMNAFALSLCWMTLFGPSTESSTFMLLAPVMARELVDYRGQSRRSRLTVMIGAVLFLISVFAYAFPHQIHRPLIATGIQPLAAILISVTVVGRVLKKSEVTPMAMLEPKATRQAA